MRNRGKHIYVAVIGILLASLLLMASPRLAFMERIHWKIYGTLMNVEHKFSSPPAAIKDILLVTIDNETLKNMPHRWPYPRSDFAKVIDNLKDSGARVIAFDFVFLGKSAPEDDVSLRSELADEKVVLASAINEKGVVDLYSIPSLTADVQSGIVTKIQDSDGATRRNLTYLVSQKGDTSQRGDTPRRDVSPYYAILSWEMQVLKAAEKIDLSSFITEDRRISFHNGAGENWTVPVEPDTKSFLIHFRANTIDFNRLSFVNVLKGDFDAESVKNKIVLVGLVSSVLGDLHRTPIGWLPGITLNANAFLTLYAHDFLKDVPKYVEWVIIIIGVIASILFILSLKVGKAAMAIFAQILLFYIFSYILLAFNLIWNYSIFPIAVTLCPFLAINIYSMLEIFLFYKGLRIKYD